MAWTKITRLPYQIYSILVSSKTAHSDSLKIASQTMQNIAAQFATGLPDTSLAAENILIV